MVVYQLVAPRIVVRAEKADLDVDVVDVQESEVRRGPGDLLVHPGWADEPGDRLDRLARVEVDAAVRRIRGLRLQ